MMFKKIRLFFAAMIILILPSPILAQETLGLDASDSLGQITNVNQLEDVQPSDWAYQALASLVERYGCIAGYPDGTFRGNRALTRYEFAAALDTCLQQVQQLIDSGTANLATKEDLETLRRLNQEFQAELKTLGARVAKLEERTDVLENNQFSTTTKLTGEAIFAPIFTDKGEATLSDRVRLNFKTSFTGKDLLKIRFQANNVPNLSAVTGTDMSRTSFDAGNNNNVSLNEVYYRWSDGKKSQFWIGTVGLDIDDIFITGNPNLNSSGPGTVTRFNRYNPSTHRGPEGAGVGLQYKLSDQADLIALYVTDSIQTSNPNQGFFNSNFSTGLQLNYKPTKNLNFGVAYLHTYYNQGSVNLVSSTGSPIGKDPFQGKAAASQDGFGLNADLKINEKFQAGGWIGYSQANAQGIDSQAELWNWNAHFSVLDVGKEGAILSLAGGQLPRAGYVKGFPSDKDTSYLVELQYKYPVNKNITITPALYAVFNPNHNNSNDPVYIGIVRTTFSF
ncbi:carbohydrate porin [Anabaena sp. FACHB-1237]|uniref:iron uptake porin n=1 Tax=Anabaena sp. FACHB-1237 TaxID=2692769 RepID=UPI001681BCE2|nr:iron uptake porin [Anabaena sp. FACHB-1237]MBD2139363.1 carbohydrate porin [Anabaena sp. FACHB-1237]